MMLEETCFSNAYLERMPPHGCTYREEMFGIPFELPFVRGRKLLRLPCIYDSTQAYVGCQVQSD